MLDLVVIVAVADSADVDRVADAVARMRSIVLYEPGCVSWEGLQSVNDPSRIVLVERWESREAWEAHDAMASIQQIYLPHILPYVTREIHVSERLGLPTSAGTNRPDTATE